MDSLSAGDSQICSKKQQAEPSLILAAGISVITYVGVKGHSAAFPAQWGHI